MAEAAVENRPPPVRFFCHKCNIEFEHVLQDYTCPFCAMGFIEELEENNIEGQSRDSNDSHPRPPFRREDDSFDVDMTVLDESSRDHAQVDEAISSTDNNDPWARWEPPWHYRDPNAPQSESPHFVNLNDFAFLLHNTQNNSTLTNPQQGGAHPRESRLLQLVQQVVLGGETDGPLVLLGGRRGLEGALGGEYVMSGEGLDAIMSQLLWQVESEGPPPLPAQAIASLPEVNITDDQVHRGLQCSICWEMFQTDEKVRELSCGHLYHQDCITPWLSLHATCPICRKSLAPPPPTTPPSGTPLQDQTTPNSTNSHTPPSLAFLFRACGVPTPSTSSSANTNNPNNTTTNNTSSVPPQMGQSPRGSMSELLNQLVSMSGALALNFSMGRAPPTVITSNAASANTPQNPRPPPPPSNYDSDMDFD